VPWYEDFFGERYLVEYADLITEDRTRSQVDAIVEILGLPAGARVLDLCCGHGRHSIELAARGYEVCGQDLCEVFLAKARADAEARGVPLSLVRGDMREILFDPPFDAVVNLFTAFGYFEDEAENEKVIAEVARVLRPGGRFLIEIINRDGIMAKFAARDWARLTDGTVITMDRQFDAVTGINAETREYHYPDGTSQRLTTAVRMYTPTELVRMVRAAGLEVLSVSGGYDSAPLGPSSTRILLLACKPA
jgi:SAM-dependent methyltransferase